MPDGPPQPPKSKKVIRIDSSTPPRSTKTDKERKKEQKSFKKMNSPKEREQRAVRSEIYNRAKADEDRTKKVGTSADGKTAKAYVEGGVKGVQKRDKKVAKETKTKAPSTPFEHRQTAKAEKKKSEDRAKFLFD